MYLFFHNHISSLKILDENGSFSTLSFNEHYPPPQYTDRRGNRFQETHGIKCIFEINLDNPHPHLLTSEKTLVLPF